MHNLFFLAPVIIIVTITYQHTQQQQQPTSINNNSFNVICVSEGAVPEEKIVFGEGNTLPSGERDGAREVVHLGGGRPNLHHVVELGHLKLFLLQTKEYGSVQF